MKNSLELLKKSYSKHGEIIRDNLAERLKIRDEMRASDAAKVYHKRKALRDILYFFENFAWTHDPRKQHLDWYGLNDATIPFLLFDFQKEYVLKLKHHIESGQDLLTEKSRDMGVSWLVITVFLWFFLQQESGNDFLLGSRKADFVDKKGAQDTLFQKLRYNLYLLPGHFLPKGFDSGKHDKVSLLENPETGSYIRGESNNSNFSTSGRYKAVLLDEFAKWEETDAQAWTATTDSSPCRLPVSTPWGIGVKFAQLRFSGAIEVATLHWSRHPLKAIGLYEDEKGKKRSTWYDLQCERRKDDPKANIGQELDIDYLKSGTPYFDNEIIQRRYLRLKATPTEARRYEFEIYEDEEGEKRIRTFPAASGRIFILHEPVEDWENRYCIAADVAEGLEKGDNSAFVVFDRGTGRDVVWFAGKVDTDILALLLMHFGREYGDAYVAPESNNHGHAVIQKMKEEYEEIYFQQDFTEIVDLDRRKLGWNTNTVTRPIMLAELREAVHDGVDGIEDISFFSEALTFIYNKNGKAEAEGDNLDDRVMCQAIKFMLHRWLPAPSEVQPEPEQQPDMMGSEPARIFGSEDSEPDIRKFW